MEENWFKPNIKRYIENKELSSGLLSAYAIHRARDGSIRPGSKDTLEGLNDDERIQLSVAVRDIEQLAKKFEVVRWMTIQKAVDDYGGISGIDPDFKVLAMATAGRLLVTISDTKPQGQGKFGGAWITLIGEDGNPGRMGIQGLCATKEEALNLLNAAISNLPTMIETNGVGII